MCNMFNDYHNIGLYKPNLTILSWSNKLISLNISKFSYIQKRNWTEFDHKKNILVLSTSYLTRGDTGAFQNLLFFLSLKVACIDSWGPRTQRNKRSAPAHHQWVSHRCHNSHYCGYCDVYGVANPSACDAPLKGLGQVVPHTEAIQVYFNTTYGCDYRKISYRKSCYPNW